MGTSTVIEFLHPSRLSFGKPEQAGSLTVVPVHHEQEPADYRLFADVAGDEVFVEEVSAGGSVPELRVTNGSAHSILLVEGDGIDEAYHHQDIDAATQAVRVLEGPEEAIAKEPEDEEKASAQGRASS